MKTKIRDISESGFITYELQAVSCNFKKINLRVVSSFYELQSNFTSCKFILQIGNEITSCEFLFMSCKFKETILRVASCALRDGNLKIFVNELPVAFYELKVYDDKFTSWKFKMIMFTSCEVAFYKLNIYEF